MNGWIRVCYISGRPTRRYCGHWGNRTQNLSAGSRNTLTTNLSVHNSLTQKGLKAKFVIALCVRRLVHQIRLCRAVNICTCEVLTHHLVAVVQLHHHVGGVAGDGLGVSVDLHVLEYQCLVPGGVQGGPHHLRGLADVQEGHVDVGVWRKTDRKRGGGVRLEHGDTVMIYCAWWRIGLLLHKSQEALPVLLTGKAVFVHRTEGLGLVDVHSEMVPVAPWKAQ